jgi:CRISPR/Cas system-associated protein endoribonuclease Cas2
MVQLQNTLVMSLKELGTKKNRLAVNQRLWSNSDLTNDSERHRVVREYPDSNNVSINNITERHYQAMTSGGMADREDLVFARAKQAQTICES